MAALALNFAATLAVTHHVSPAGSDGNAGDAEHPWRTLARASRATYADGDSLLLQRNSTWIDDPLTIASAHGMTVGAWGDATLPRPLLQFGRPVSGSTVCALFSAVDRLTIDSLHVSGCSEGIALVGAAKNATSVTMTNNYFRDIRTPFLAYTPPNPDWASAISLRSGHFVNLTIRNNIAVRVDQFFSSRAFADGMRLLANTVQQCSGNCYSLGSGVGISMRDSVMLRDMSTRLFLYGTTDVIVGGLKGNNELVNNDFNARGEYQGGPDGCAFDFETAATGFVVSGNTFYRSWGAGIMIFGHDTTSQGIAITDNTFAYDGCVQNRGDRGGLAVMCPGGHRPSGVVSGNSFYTKSSPDCDGVPAIYVNPSVKGCGDNLTMVK